MKKERDSNFELLRIVCMLMIIGLHYFNGEVGGALNHVASPQLNYYVTVFCESLFIIGVNCFILITGYFQIEKNSVRLDKVLGLIVLTLFYGLASYFIAVAMGVTAFSVNELKQVILPFFFGRAWFIWIYIILYLLTPFINAVLNTLNKRTYTTLLLIILTLFSVWPSIFPNPPSSDQGYGIISFVMMYAIGGWIKKHYDRKYSKLIYLTGYVGCSVILGVLTMIFMKNGFSKAWNYNFIVTVASSVFLFLFFARIKIKSKIINYLSAYVLGVYLIHSDFYLGKFAYRNLLHTENYWSNGFFVPDLILSIVVIYALSTLIDILRKYAVLKLNDFLRARFSRIYGMTDKYLKKSISV